MPTFDPRSYIGAFNPPLPGSSPIAKDTRKLQIDDTLARLAGGEQFDRLRFQEGEMTGREQDRIDAAADAARLKHAQETFASFGVGPDDPKYAELASTKFGAGVAKTLADALLTNIQAGAEPIPKIDLESGKNLPFSPAVPGLSGALGADYTLGVPPSVLAAAATVAQAEGTETTWEYVEVNGEQAGSIVNIKKKKWEERRRKGTDYNEAEAIAEIAEATDTERHVQQIVSGVQSSVEYGPDAEVSNIQTLGSGAGYRYSINGTPGFVAWKAELDGDVGSVSTAPPQQSGNPFAGTPGATYTPPRSTGGGRSILTGPGAALANAPFELPMIEPLQTTGRRPRGYMD